MRILLIGGNGFIGSPLGRELCVHGHAVAVLHRTTGGNIDEDVLRIQGNRNRLWDSIGPIEQFSPYR
jgi:nucleoside-diphosphate-sugar epimerase